MLSVIAADSAHAQQDPPGCILNSLTIGVGRPEAIVKADGANTIPYTVTVTVPDVIGFECAVLLSEITFFSPANPPDTPGLFCDASNGVVLATNVSLDPGDTIRFTGNAADADPPNDIFFDAALLYTIDPADAIPNPDPSADGTILQAGACAQGIAFTGDVPGIAEGQNNISTVLLQPEIELVKTAVPASICEGQDTEVTYTMAVTVGTGDTSLEDLVVTDPNCGPINFLGGDFDADNELDLNETWTYTCTTTINTETTNTASVTATDVQGLNCVVTDDGSFTVTGNDPPPCTITADRPCDGGNGSASVVPTAGASYVWGISGGSLTGGQGTPNITYSHTPGQSISISVTVTDANGCTCESNETFDPLDNPSCAITAPDICDGASGVASVSDAGPGAQYFWSISGGRIDDGDNTPSISYSHNSGQQLQLNITIIDANGCMCTGDVIVDFEPDPDCTITAPEICDGGSGIASVTNVGACDYFWTVNGGTITGGQGTPNIAYDHTPGQLVTIGVDVDCGGCTCSTVTTATVNPNPDCTITAPAVCNGAAGVASAPDAGPGASYAWSVEGGRIDDGDNTPQISFTHSPNQSLFVSVAITTADGCMCEANVPVVVNDNPVCTISPTDPVCTGSMDNIFEGPVGDFSYEWSIEGNGTLDLPTDQQTVSVDAGAAGAFTLTLIVTDSATGCSTDCSQIINVGTDVTCDITGPATVCLGQGGIFCGPPAMDSYSWSVIAGDGVIDGPDNLECVNVTAGVMASFTLQLTVVDPIGCECTSTFDITVGEGPNFELIPQVDCAAPTDQIEVVLRMSDVAAAGVTVEAFQAFVSYDTNAMIFLPGQSMYTPAPFGQALVPLSEIQPGVIFASAGLAPGQLPTDMDADLAILTFAILQNDCEMPNFDFNTMIQPNFLAGTGGIAINPCLLKSEPITVDGVAPRIMECCNDREIKVDAMCMAVVPDLTDPNDPNSCPRLVVTEDCTPLDELVITQFPAAGSPIDLNNAQGEFVQVVTITVADCAGNTATCMVNLTYTDNMPPDITCPENRTLKVDNSCETRVPDLLPEVIVDDNCDNPTLISLEQDPPADTIITVGNQDVTITATDNFGNTAQCTVRLDVIDSDPPKINCPDQMFRKVGDDCLYQLEDLSVHATIFDNCTPLPLINITQIPSPGITFLPPGTHEIVIIAEAGGLMESCTINLIVSDNIDPMITCPATQTETVDANCQGTLGDYRDLAVVTDNCTAPDEIEVTQLPIPGTVFLGMGTVEVTLIADDGNGNTASCTFNVEFIDEVPPTIIACSPQHKIPADEQCMAVTPDVRGGVQVEDNCTPNEDLIITQDPEIGTPLGLGRHIVTVTVMDASGQMAMCETNVNVLDLTPPTIDCTNVVVECTGDGMAFVNALPIVVSDNCSPEDNISVNCFLLDDNGQPGKLINPDGDFFPLGRNFISCIAIDDMDNSAKCIMTVTVVDTQPPVITNCADGATVSANADCKYTIEDLTGMIDVTDACGEVVQITQNPPPGAMVNGLGNFLVTFTAFDEAGLSASCQAIFTVIDDTPPIVVNCPAGAKVKADEQCNGQVPNFLFNLVVADNCDEPEEIIIEQIPPSGTILPIGTHPVTIKVTDTSGNMNASCVAMLEINDMDAPVIWFCGNDATAPANDDCLGIVPDMTGDVVVTDNCFANDDLIFTQDPPAGSLAPLGKTIVIIQVTDPSDNTSMCQLSLVVEDETPPVITCPADVTLETIPELCSVEYDAPLPTATDNCDANPLLAPSRSDGQSLLAPFGLGKTVITWLAVDEAGNEMSCEQSVLVVDLTPPTITCPPDITVNADLTTECQPGQGCCASVDPGQATGRDSCDVNVQVTGIRDDGKDLAAPYPAGTTTIVWTAVDNDGNESTCEQEITVNDMATLVVSLDMLDVTAASITRCVEFTLHDCETLQTEVINVDVPLINGSARNFAFKIPCGVQWDCVVANDPLHTLRRHADLTVAFDQFHADFTGLNGLPGGDLNNDGHIDIFDSMIHGNQNGTNYGSGSTLCGTVGPNADINGDGMANFQDLGIIQDNFIEKDDAICCPDSIAGTTAPVISIAVEQLAGIGMADAAWMDFNGDGFIDLVDMVLRYNASEPQSPDFAAESGSWFAADNWEAGRTPDADSDIQIGSLVRIDSFGAVARDVRLQGGATLHVSTGSLQARSLTIESGAMLQLDDVNATLVVDSLDLQPGATILWTAGVIEIDGGRYNQAELDLVVGATADMSTLRLLSDATADIDGDTIIGALPGSLGTIDVDGSSLNTLGTLIVGQAGEGTLLVTAGSVITSDRGVIGALQSAIGHVTIENGTWINLQSLQIGDAGVGELSLIEGHIISPITQIGWTGQLSGDGIIDGMLINEGQLDAGDLTINGDFIQTEDGAMLISIDRDMGVLSIDGTAELGGQLSIEFAEGYVPAIGDEFVILTATQIVDQLTQIDVPEVGADQRLQLLVMDDQILVRVLPVQTAPSTTQIRR